MARGAGLGAGVRGAGAGAFPADRADGRGAPAGGAGAVLGQHALPQHHPARPRGAASRRPRDRAQDPLLHPLERAGDRAAGQQGKLRAGRAYRQLPVLGPALRHRLHAFLARAHGRAWRRSDLRAGPLLARHLRAQLPRGPAVRGAAAQVPPGGRWRRPELLSASLADARLLAVPDRLDGPRPIDGDLPGPLPQIPARTRPRRHRQPRRSGPSWATASATSRRAWAPSRSAAASIWTIWCS